MTQPQTLTALLGQQIAALRREKFSSGQRFADALTKAGWPTSRATIADIESGRRRFITVDELLAVADVLDVWLPDLLASATAVKAVSVGERTWRPTGRDRTRGGQRVEVAIVDDPDRPGHSILKVVRP
jgi:transcriptional regulator with XRE-family HTH domain